MTSKPWFTSHAVTGSLAALILAIFHVVSTVMENGWSAVDWQPVAGGVVALVVIVLRVRHGNDPDSHTAPLTAKGAGRAGLVGLVACVALAGSVAASSCRPLTPDQRDTGALISGLSCAAVGLVCGSGVLPPAAQRWCHTAVTACGGARATVVAVLDELVYDPGPHSTAVMLFARPPDLILASEWAAVCAAAEDRWGYEPDGLACGAVLDALASGAETVSVPIVR